MRPAKCLHHLFEIQTELGHPVLDLGQILHGGEVAATAEDEKEFARWGENEHLSGKKMWCTKARQ